MIRSICREVSESVPFRFDSWPTTLRTSGSGAAIIFIGELFSGTLEAFLSEQKP
jgi:hypothetical protein